MKFGTLAGLISLAITGAYGWGASGHHAVGYVAMEFLAPKALLFVKEFLGANYSYSLGPAATWPDEIKSLPGAPYLWASELHYVDAEDTPPTSCSVVEARDCANGRCILTAIANYTTRVVEKKLPAIQRQEALKFLTHFLGDIGQPLHVENLAVGGNTIKVTCGGNTTNLHALWDTSLVEKLIAKEYESSVTGWAHSLVSDIKYGKYKKSAADWVSCSSTTAKLHPVNATAEGIVPLKCPLVWAKDSNVYDCSYVFSYANGTDLCDTTYYDNAVPIIESQIAKQGYRLAAWLNVLFDGSVKGPSKPGNGGHDEKLGHDHDDGKGHN